MIIHDIIYIISVASYICLLVGMLGFSIFGRIALRHGAILEDEERRRDREEFESYFRRP